MGILPKLLTNTDYQFPCFIWPFDLQCISEVNVVMKLMGHSSIATTQEFYSQVDEDHQVKAAASIRQMIEGPKGRDDVAKENETYVQRASEAISEEFGG